MREYSEVREILCDLLSDSIKDGKIAIGDVEIIKNMLSGIEKTYKIEMFEEDGSYSRSGDWEPICAALMPAAPATVAGSGIPWDVIAGMEDILDTHLLT